MRRPAPPTAIRRIPAAARRRGAAGPALRAGGLCMPSCSRGCARAAGQAAARRPVPPLAGATRCASGMRNGKPARCGRANPTCDPLQMVARALASYGGGAQQPAGAAGAAGPQGAHWRLTAGVRSSLQLRCRRPAWPCLRHSTLGVVGMSIVHKPGAGQGVGTAEAAGWMHRATARHAACAPALCEVRSPSSPPPPARGRGDEGRI